MTVSKFEMLKKTATKQKVRKKKEDLGSRIMYSMYSTLPWGMTKIFLNIFRNRNENFVATFEFGTFRFTESKHSNALTKLEQSGSVAIFFFFFFFLNKRKKNKI